MDPALKIVIVDQNPIRAAILEDGLREAGYVHVVRIDQTSHLLARIYAIDPDVILIDLEDPSRDVLEQMFQVSRAMRRRSRPPSMPGFPPISSAGCARSASRTSSISASRASTPSRGCRTSSTARGPRSKSAK